MGKHVDPHLDWSTVNKELLAERSPSDQDALDLMFGGEHVMDGAWTIEAKFVPFF